MPVKFPFEYSESFSESVLSNIPVQLRIKGSADSELLLILRLLSGVVNCQHLGTMTKITQRENYFSLSLKSNSARWYKSFPNLIAENYSAQQLANFIESTKFKNKSFYKNILCEISYYFYYQKKGIHSTAFVFLYRALEHVSYAFPLIYISNTGDFLKSYSYLRDLMNGDKSTGELGFFKKFIETVYKDDPIRESSLDFEIILNSEDEQNRVFDLLYGLCKSEMVAEATSKPRLLSIKYVEVGGLLINLRNRFFHFMNGGQKNIESSKIGDVDLFFFLVNRRFLYWLSTIFLAVVSKNALEFETTKSGVT